MIRRLLSIRLRRNSDHFVTTARRDPTTFSLTPVATTAMTLKSEATYPSRRTYVLKLRSDAAPSALAGRIENVVTGGQREFLSAEELLESIIRDLQASQPVR